MGMIMKPSAAILMLGLTSLASPAFAEAGISSADDSQTAAVSVGVYAQHAGGKIVYHYRVVNNSQQNISAVTIGCDNQNDANPNNDINELLDLPAGWNSKLGIPSTSANSPTGWRVSVIAPEENATHAIAWETMNDRSPRILTGQTVNKMSIALDNPDNNYLSGHALVTFSDGNPINLTVPLKRLDITPPSLTIILRPDTLTPQNGKLVAIKASFIVKDDYDRLPEIKLESITANEPLGASDIRDASIGLDDRYFKVLAESKTTSGRIYTVTYSATDASGNQSIASATVMVTTTVAQPTPASAPHD
jgi:hypothetical protein